MTATHVVLLRGINVGKAKRIAMGDLRDLLGGLGYEDVATVLTSGNAVVSAPGGRAEAMASAIEAAVADRFGMDVRVFVRTVAAVRAAIEANPLRDEAASDPTRLLVAFLDPAVGRRALRPVLDGDWAPEAVAAGRGVLYLWHPDGVTGSALATAVAKAVGTGSTHRNLATLRKVLDRAG